MSTDPSPGNPQPWYTQPLVIGGGIVAAVVVVIIVVVVASGGDDGDDGDEIVQASPTVEADATETIADDDGDGDGDGGGDGDGDGDGDLGDLASLAGEATDGVTAKVTYKVTTKVGGETTEAEWVIVQRPPDSRIEMSSMEGGQQFTTIIITSGDKSYLCTSSGGEGSCLETDVDAADAQTAPLASLFNVPEALADTAGDVDIAETSQRRIAGVDATCFTIAGGLDDIGESEVCFSDDGLLLFSRSETGDDSFLFEATSASTDVTDKDFEPPFPVTDFEIPDFETP